MAIQTICPVCEDEISRRRGGDRIFVAMQPCFRCRQALAKEAGGEDAARIEAMRPAMSWRPLAKKKTA